MISKQEIIKSIYCVPLIFVQFPLSTLWIFLTGSLTILRVLIDDSKGDNQRMHDVMFAHTPYFKTRIIHKNVLIFIFLSRKIMESRVSCKYAHLYLLCSVPTRFHEIPCSSLRGVADQNFGKIKEIEKSCKYAINTLCPYYLQIFMSS